MKLLASSRQRSICRVLTAFALATFAYAAEPPAAPTRDHILLITVDDLNDWITCLSDEKSGNGHPQASTPHLDLLAKRGVLFTNAHCQAPIYRPSRTSFLSGLPPSTTGVYANQSEHDAKGMLKPGIDTPWLPNRFKQAGYRTYAVGKLHHQGHKGLGEVLGPQTGQGPYPSKKMGVPSVVAKGGIWDFGAWPHEEQFTDWQIAQGTIGNIEKPISMDNAPRFVSLGFYRPHVPLFAPKKWFAAAPRPDEIRLAPYLANDLDDLPAISSRISKRVSFP